LYACKTHLVTASLVLWSALQCVAKWQVILYGIFRVQNGGRPKVGSPVQPNTLNMPKAGPGLVL